jgi:transitional endoplasmic reticulum ATPase
VTVLVVIVGVVVAAAAFAGGLTLGRSRVRARSPEQPAPASSPAPAPPDPEPAFNTTAGAELPKFAAVGGMDAVKAELRDTFDVVLGHPEEAAEYHITWNGILLHGPPGVGKTFLARATAGEFGLTLIAVSASDLVGATRAEGAHNVDDLFAFASAHRPALLFFDEFDAIAQRGESNDLKQQAILGALVAALERTRAQPDLVVMAATNNLDALDRSVIRPGRFDRHIRLDLPDTAARAAIFTAALSGLPLGADVDGQELARRTEGATPAALARAVRAAVMSAFAQARRAGHTVTITQSALLAALSDGGDDRPTVEGHTWADVVLSDDVKRELQELQYLLEDSDAARTLGIDPPSGLLLAGPPGNGKTTIAKVLAAQAKCSFYPVSAADIADKWYGQSEQNIAHLFERARENSPSIIFVDEIDGLAPKRGSATDATDRVLSELLDEIDGIAGQRGVFVIGATNRADQLDPALVRGGRLSRTITVPLPDEAARLALLKLFSAKMPLDHVDLPGLAAVTEGWSGGDLRALCQEAALAALVAARERGEQVSVVNGADFERALRERA